MSGSGGGGFGGGGGGDPVIACDRLIIETAISSPRASVVDKLKVGDVLAVVLEEQAGTAVVALYFQGEKGGGVTSANTGRLRECIRDGTTYEATVISRSDGQVRVRIKPISS